MRYAATSSEARYITLYPILLLLAARRGQRTEPRPYGYLLVAIGVLLQTIGIVADAASIARLGLPLAIVGLARASGFLRVRVALLSLWLVPIPISVVSATSPEPESTLAALGAGVVGLLGADARASGPLLLGGPQGQLALRPADGGLVLAWVLAGVGWYLGVRLGVDFIRVLTGSLRWAASALVLQPFAIVLAIGIYALGFPDLARTGLTYLPWLAAAMLAVYWAERGGATGSPSSNR
jgi:hypothetical protein